MLPQFFVAGLAFFCIFILFLVLSKTLNNVINHLIKLHYLLQKEYDLKKERLVLAQLMKEENEKSAQALTAAMENSGPTVPQQDNIVKENNANKRQ